MQTLEEIKRLLRDRRLNVVAKETKIHRNTLANIRDGRTKNPGWETLKQLDEYLSQHV